MDMNKPEYNLNIFLSRGTMGEVKGALDKKKMNKAHGIEDIPSQELKSP